jgi:hypothetical protein
MMGGVKDSYKSKFSCEKLPMLSVSLIRNNKKLVIHKIIQLIKRKFFKR